MTLLSRKYLGQKFMKLMYLVAVFKTYWDRSYTFSETYNMHLFSNAEFYISLYINSKVNITFEIEKGAIMVLAHQTYVGFLDRVCVYHYFFDAGWIIMIHIHVYILKNLHSFRSCQCLGPCRP